MKYTIAGFSQEYLMTLGYDELQPNGKMKHIKLKWDDVCLLRYFVDIHEDLYKVTINSVDYWILTYKQILEDLPILNMNKKTLSLHFKKLCNMNLLTMTLVEGHLTAFGFGPVLNDLITYTEDCKFYKFTSTKTKMHQAAYNNFLQKVLNKELPALSEELKSMPYKDFLKTLYWRCITKYLKENFLQCSRCTHNKLLQVHHKTYENHGREHIIPIMYNDLEVLCSKCHKMEHNLED